MTETDDRTEKTNAEGVAEDAEASLVLEVVIGSEEQTLRLSDFADNASPDHFIRAKHPGMNEDKITSAGAQAHMGGFAAAGNRAERRAMKGRATGVSEMTLSLNVQAAFIAKCLYQITDYCLPMRNATTDQRTEARYAAAKGGNKDVNRAFYEKMLLPGSEGLRDLVEMFLDWVAGRDEEAGAALEALKNAPRSRQSTS